MFLQGHADITYSSTTSGPCQDILGPEHESVDKELDNWTNQQISTSVKGDCRYVLQPMAAWRSKSFVTCRPAELWNTKLGRGVVDVEVIVLYAEEYI
jgi:hypothetical protein